jgi:hypothetical protein
MAGPAWAAAAWPVSTNMPAPMMLPIPSAIRLMADSVRLSGTLPRVTGSCVARSAASACNTAIGFLFHNFDMRLPDLHPVASDRTKAMKILFRADGPEWLW